jgi:hypothetical protein
MLTQDGAVRGLSGDRGQHLDRAGLRGRSTTVARSASTTRSGTCARAMAGPTGRDSPTGTPERGFRRTASYRRGGSRLSQLHARDARRYRGRSSSERPARLLAWRSRNTSRISPSPRPGRAGAATEVAPARRQTLYERDAASTGGRFGSAGSSSGSCSTTGVGGRSRRRSSSSRYRSSSSNCSWRRLSRRIHQS